MEKKNNVIHLRIDDNLKQLLERNAQQERRTLTNYIYMILADAMTEKGELVKPVFSISERI